MQPPVAPALPHTRTRPLHWAGTAAALAGVLGLAAAVQPPASADPAGGTGAARAEAPDPAQARYPVDCGGRTKHAVDVLDSGSADFDGEGRAETVAVVRCRTGIGTPPAGIFVLTHAATADAPPRVAETLLSPREGMNAGDFTVGARGPGVIAATLLGYSSPDVPRCCPDQQRKVTWEWRDGTFVLVPGPVAGSVQPA
ncbi:hypothetical protein [Streptomyces sp. JJ36]|uniref:hypothetical protein n=1 Tax=Streptomyces sp. JJ36 TaxID=2736645 RepID=UPI001F3B7927|nr:hypothetical protein [Streptomyces sp. JJ36]MCF6523222.1 hypothetical protein [Streptomyces sp. JJ36]